MVAKQWQVRKLGKSKKVVQCQQIKSNWPRSTDLKELRERRMVRKVVNELLWVNWTRVRPSGGDLVFFFGRSVWDGLILGR